MVYDGTILLIDENHTPDSSRYFYAEGYAERQATGERQKQLSKEFVREWLIAGGFMGKEGQQIPDMDDAFVQSVTDRYVSSLSASPGAASSRHPRMTSTSGYSGRWRNAWGRQGGVHLKGTSTNHFAKASKHLLLLKTNIWFSIALFGA